MSESVKKILSNIHTNMSDLGCSIDSFSEKCISDEADAARLRDIMYDYYKKISHDIYEIRHILGI